MSGEFSIDDLVEIMRVSVGLDEGVRFDGDVADVPFAENGYDSLAMLELASQLQHRLGLVISDEAALEQLTTPRQAVEFVNLQLSAKAA
jgi:act minimal PKS acyl carrier protein